LAKHKLCAKARAWETYGGETVERARNRACWPNRLRVQQLDDLAWLVQNESLSQEDDHSGDVRAIRLGLYELGRLSGLTGLELEARQVLDDEVRRERAELRELVISSRPRVWRRVWLRIRR
jgi:hypothetical protein